MLRDQLDRWGFGVPYRFATDVCARVLISVPSLEAPFVFLSRRLWSAPTIGRVLRSVTYRYIERLARTPNRFRSVTVLGLHLNANVTDFVFSGIYFGNVPYEEHLTRYFSEHLGPGSVFVDVGANCGYFSMLAAGLVGPSGRVFSFEPNPPVFRELADHLDRNGLRDRVHAFELALGARPDSRPLYVTQQHSGLSTMVSESIVAAGHFGEATTVAVQTIRFDDWREKHSIGHVDLMKIDVEGFEAQVLAGMVESLRALRIKRVVCETNWDSPAHRLLVEIGFRPAALENVGSVWNIAYEL